MLEIVLTHYVLLTTSSKLAPNILFLFYFRFLFLSFFSFVYFFFNFFCSLLY